mgnify:CR=1 FL=1
MKANNRIPKRLAKKLANVARAIEPHRGEIAEWTSPVSETIAMGHIRPALEREGVLVLTSVDRIESMDTQRCGRVTVAHTTHALVVADSGEKILLNSCGVAPTHPSTPGLDSEPGSGTDGPRQAAWIAMAQALMRVFQLPTAANRPSGWGTSKS